METFQNNSTAELTSILNRKDEGNECFGSENQCSN